MSLAFEEKNFGKLPILHEQPKSEKEEKHLREIVEVEFQNLEEPGLMQKFTYGDSKNRMTFTLLHNGRYRLPRHVVRHLETRQIPMYEHAPTKVGPIRKSLIGYTSRFQCRPVWS